MTITSIVRLIFFAIFIVSALIILAPFAPSFVWAVIISVSIWPIYTKYEGYFKPGRFSVILSATLIVLLVTPMLLAGFNLVSLFPEIVKTLKTIQLSNPPEWLMKSPIWIEPVSTAWSQLQKDFGNIQQYILPYLNNIMPFVLDVSQSILKGAFHMTLAVVLNAFILPHGQEIWAVLKRIVDKIYPKLHFDILEITSKTIHGITIGVVGTAFGQMFFMAIALIICDIRGAIILSFLTFLFAIAQIPTILIWGPIAGYLFFHQETMMAIFVLFVGVVLLGILDNILKPLLISKEAQLPMVLVFLGVIGGLLAWGLIGVFLGPVILALGYILAKSWLSSPD